LKESRKKSIFAFPTSLLTWIYSKLPFCFLVGAAALSADNNIKQKLAEEVRKREELQKELGLQVREQHNYLGFLTVHF
jgi:hypothetical protein